MNSLLAKTNRGATHTAAQPIDQATSGARRHVTTRRTSAAAVATTAPTCQPHGVTSTSWSRLKPRGTRMSATRRQTADNCQTTNCVHGHSDPPGYPTVTSHPEMRVRLRPRSEEHTSELQSQSNLVSRL